MPRHLLQLEGLDAPALTALLDRAESFIPAARGEAAAPASLAGKLVANLFFEDSTRTRLSFAAKTKRLIIHALLVLLVSIGKICQYSLKCCKLNDALLMIAAPLLCPV